MSEQKYAKAIFACRIITVLSAVVLIILITVLTASSSGDKSWLDGLADTYCGVRFTSCLREHSCPHL